MRRSGTNIQYFIDFVQVSIMCSACVEHVINGWPNVFLSYNAVKLYIGIMQVWDFLPQKITPKTPQHLLCDI